MLEDVTGEGAMRLEEAIRRKRARPDESGRADVAMEVAARNNIRPVQYGGSSSSWEVRQEPSRRREAEEQLGGDVVRARLQNPQGVVRTAEEARPQPREELEAAVDSICKHVKRAGCVARGRIGRRGDCSCQDVRRSWGAQSASSQMWLWTCGDGWDLASAAGRQECWKTLQAERPELVVGSPPSRRHSPWIKDEREARLPGDQTLELLLRRLSMANRAWITLSPRTSMGSFLVGLRLLESSERTARCGCGAMRPALVWIDGALAFEGRWLGRTSIDAANWLDDNHE